MALPQAVQKISDAAEAAAVESGIKPGVKPVDAGGNPVMQSQAATVTPIEPTQGGEDWEKRFKGLTTTHQQIKQQLDQAQSTIGANQQTIASLQQQVSQLMNSQKAPAAEAVKPDQDAPYKAWLEKLPKKIKDDYDEGYLRDQFIIQSSMTVKQPSQDNTGIDDLKQDVASVKQYMAKSQTQLYEDAMDQAYPDNAWINLASGDKWSEFCRKEVSPVDNRTWGEIVKEGSDSHRATTVIWVLKQYEAHQSELDPGDNADAVANNSLSGQLTPDAGTGSGGGDPIAEINAQAKTFTQSQVTQFFNDVATTNKYSAEDAKAVEMQIVAAQAAGKIIPG